MCPHIRIFLTVMHRHDSACTVPYRTNKFPTRSRAKVLIFLIYTLKSSCIYTCMPPNLHFCDHMHRDNPYFCLYNRKLIKKGRHVNNYMGLLNFLRMQNANWNFWGRNMPRCEFLGANMQKVLLIWREEASQSFQSSNKQLLLILRIKLVRLNCSFWIEP